LQQPHSRFILCPNNGNGLLNVGVVQVNLGAILALHIPLVLRLLVGIASLVLVNDRHEAAAQCVLFQHIAEKILLPVGNHLHQNGLDLGAERLADGKGAARYLRVQTAVLEDPGHGGVGAAVADLLDILQHGNLCVHALYGLDGKDDGVSVFFKAIDEIVLIAQALHLLLLGFIHGNFAHGGNSFQFS
jgi:hypothetical protein